MDELQAAMIVVPSEVIYQPKFTYIWTLGVGRFPDALRRRVGRDTALREIARCFLAGAGMTIPANWRACHRLVAAGRRPRQPCAGGRRLRDHARARCVSVGCTINWASVAVLQEVRHAPLTMCATAVLVSALALSTPSAAPPPQSGAPQQIDLAGQLAAGKLRAVNRDVTPLQGDRRGVHVSEKGGTWSRLDRRQ